MKKQLSLMMCAAMAIGTIGVVPAMAADEDGKVTIEYWVNDRHDSEYMNEVIDKYNEENEDNIYVKMTLITDNYETMLSTAYTGGTAPDIAGNLSINFAQNGMPVSYTHLTLPTN